MRVVRSKLCSASRRCPERVRGLLQVTPELREKIVAQVEFYFSDRNLPTDKFLLKNVRKK